MSNVYFDDYGLAEAAARKRRLQQSLANQQASFMGQQRGARRTADIQQQYSRNFNPLISSFGRRGLVGPSVESGITRAGLSRYAESLQKDLGRESEAMQDSLNEITMRDAQQQEDLENYLAQLRLDKARNVMNTASTIKSLTSY
jgi:hypothetical protein